MAPQKNLENLVQENRQDLDRDEYCSILSNFMMPLTGRRNIFGFIQLFLKLALCSEEINSIRFTDY